MSGRDREPASVRRRVVTRAEVASAELVLEMHRRGQRVSRAALRSARKTLEAHRT